MIALRLHLTKTTWPARPARFAEGGHGQVGQPGCGWLETPFTLAMLTIPNLVDDVITWLARLNLASVNGVLDFFNVNGPSTTY